MASRCTDAELAERQAAALQLLAGGAGTALTAQILSERFGVSLRTAQRYVNVASLELIEPLTTVELDRQAALSLYRLDMLAGQAAQSGDSATCIRASRAHAAALAQIYRAVTSTKPTRIRLPTATTRASPPVDGAEDPLPF